MNGLSLHTGNRLESLVHQLAEVVSAAPPASPLQPETILIQSLGMGRWLSLQLAEKLGICMNVEFPFPRAYLDATLRDLVPEIAPPETFSPELMTWKIHRLLPDLLDEPGFAPVQRFLRDGDAIKLFQLSQRLAALFDQYLAYRPDMLCEWEAAAGDHELLQREMAAGGDAAWQAPLWRQLNAEHAAHLGTVLQRLPEAIEKKKDEQAQAHTYTSRLSIFGITSLPPAQMEVLFQLAATRPVHLFLLSPSQEYHGDDLTPKQRARLGLAAPADDEGGNPLLTSLGRLHAHFTKVILETDEHVGHRTIDPEPQFTAATGDTLLHRLQRDILHAAPPEKLPMAEGDDSIQLHSCHSPMREVETLYDRLLSFLDTDNADNGRLLPRDILVMAPDIEKYAPFIHAVFTTPEDAALRIPYSIADRHPRSESHAIDTFLRLLELVDARCTAPEIYTLLQSQPFRHRFGFDDAELEQIHHWLQESGIRWGIDAAHREAFDLPAYAENSWRSGFDRLLLGYAMTGDNARRFEEILPLDDVEGSHTELLGRLLTASEGVLDTLGELKAERALGEWPAVLEGIVDRFFTPGESSGGAPALGTEEIDAVRQLRTTIAKLTTLAEAAGAEQRVPFSVMRIFLNGTLGEATGRGRFLTGGVTFCALKPMRSIPAKVIWLLGMDDGVFPRRNEPLQFDLIAKKWRLGDRSTRDDDRALFLEAIVSAREKLCISTLGRSIKNNEPIPPSIVVSELLDYLDLALALPPGESARTRLLVEHRLHAFSPVYFQQGSPVATPLGQSYSQANAAVARATLAARPPLFDGPMPDFPFQTPLPALEESRHAAQQISLDRLIAFLSSPALFYLRERLGAQMREYDESLQESEPLALNSLQLYQIRSELLDTLLSSSESDSPLPSHAAFVARGQLPPGTLGEQHYGQITHAARVFHTRLRGIMEECGPLAEPLAFTLPFALPTVELVLTGSLQPMYGSTLCLYRASKVKGKDRLKAWVTHLAHGAVLEASGRGETPVRTLVIGEDKQLQYHSDHSPPEFSPTAVLQQLLALYWEGHSRPLPIFEQASLGYAKGLAEGEEKAMQEARKGWYNAVKFIGDENTPAHRTCFPAECGEPFSEEFRHLATTLFGPLLAAETSAS